MSFLKNFFNDEEKIVGLCGFDSMKPSYKKKLLSNEIVFKSIQSELVFETDFEQNVLLF